MLGTSRNTHMSRTMLFSAQTVQSLRSTSLPQTTSVLAEIPSPGLIHPRQDPTALAILIRGAKAQLRRKIEELEETQSAVLAKGLARIRELEEGGGGACGLCVGCRFEGVRAEVERVAGERDLVAAELGRMQGLLGDVDALVGDAEDVTFEDETDAYGDVDLGELDAYGDVDFSELGVFGGSGEEIL